MLNGKELFVETGIRILIFIFLIVFAGSYCAGVYAIKQEKKRRVEENEF
jgi:hypothetical protein